MKTFLFTSDRYVNIVADHAQLMNKFTQENQQITVLGFSEPTASYPENYNFVSMGNQDDFPKQCWSEPIRPFIEAIDENYFIMWWDDTFPIAQVDADLFDEAVNLVKSGEAQKVHFFWGSDKQNAACTEFNENFKKLSQTAEYRSALVPGVWNKEYFLKHLHKNFTPWDYEVRNMPDTTCDGANILIAKNKPIAPWVNMFRQGSFNDSMWKNYNDSPTNCFAWNEFQTLTPDVAKIVGKYEGIIL
jgi:hypothetical protein